MTEAILDIKSWGNNLGVRLPAAIARAAHLHVNQRVKLSVVDNQVVITPVDEPLTLEERLAKFDPVRHGDEVMATSTQSQNSNKKEGVCPLFY
jgi:antitoxin MazE